MNPAPLFRDTPARLVARWRHVLRFRIGANGCVDQLPHAEDFPPEYPTDDEHAASRALWEVLGIACLKLCRSSARGEDVPIDANWGALAGLPSIGYTPGGMPPAPVGYVHKMALRAPDRLPLLHARLDALDNATLHAMAMAAVQGLPVVPDVFAGLME